MPNAKKSEVSTATFFEAMVRVLDDYGLHARPAALLAKTAQNFTSEVRLLAEGQSANAKSILEILSLAVPKNAELALRCQGPDAPAAGEALLTIFQDEALHKDRTRKIPAGGDS